MLERRALGAVPKKPHLRNRSDAGDVIYEECLTRGGFEGPFSMLYHRGRPHEALPAELGGTFRTPELAGARGLLRRHYRCLDLPAGGTSAEGRTPLLVNRDLTLGFLRPSEPDRVVFSNGDGDELFFVLEGSGTLRSSFGDLAFEQGDYVYVPKGVLHRLLPAPGVAQAWLWLEFAGALGLPERYRNGIGQLRMDAPYSHRDFRAPAAVAPVDEGILDVVVKRRGAFHAYRMPHPPLDVLGWDGTLYPFAFPIGAFSPRVGAVHLPPPVHATFEAPGALVCSFVPRPLDFHPDANPCPYPHTSVDIDEVLLYANGEFGSRRGIGVGSLSHHPAGVPHGPHPGAYESAVAGGMTRELAVMLDCAAPLDATSAAVAVEDGGYHASFVERG